MLEPGVAAYTTEATGYASANRAARARLSRDLARSPMIYPPDDVRARFYTVTPGTAVDGRERTQDLGPRRARPLRLDETAGRRRSRGRVQSETRPSGWMLMSLVSS